MPCSLMKFAKNVYSQNGEDGVIAEVLRRLDLKGPGTFVEFGAGDGRSLSNTLHLAEQGWSGVWIEADTDSADKARAEAARFEGRVEVLNTLVAIEGDNVLDKLLSQTRVVLYGKEHPFKTTLPTNLDFMSIDIDSYDYEVWESLKVYRPKLVLIEINSSVPLGVRQRHGNGKEGTSFTSMVELANDKRYQLLAHTGNLLFVDRNLGLNSQIPVAELLYPDTIFDDKWVQWSRGGK